MEQSSLPVAVLDSGVGGISVLREMVQVLPHENFWFYGDSANAPYGTKSMEEVRDLVLANVERMAGKGIKAVVIACNTATSAAIDVLREKYEPEIPVVGIEPALKPAALSGNHPRVVVMATPATVKAEKFRRQMEMYQDQAEIIPVGCYGLMEYVEAGRLSGPETEAFIRKTLEPCMDKKIDKIVLGCTHYPFLKEAICHVAGPDTDVIDGSEGTALQLKRRLAQLGLLSGRKGQGTVLLENGIPEKIELERKLLYGTAYAGKL